MPNLENMYRFPKINLSPFEKFSLSSLNDDKMYVFSKYQRKVYFRIFDSMCMAPSSKLHIFQESV